MKFYFLVIPFVPMLTITLASLSIVSAILTSWFTKNPTVASVVECIVLRCGSFGIALLIIMAILVAAVWLEVGLVLSEFCTDADTNVLLVVHGIDFTANDNATAFMGVTLTQLVHRVADYYVAGIGDNPALTFITDAANKLIEIGLLVERVHIVLDFASTACEGASHLNVSQTVLALESIIDDVDGLLHAQNIWPYYEVMMHHVACGTLPIGMCWLILMNTIVGLVFFPVLAILADIDLRKWSSWKEDNYNEHYGEYAGYAKISQGEDDEEALLPQSMDPGTDVVDYTDAADFSQLDYTGRVDYAQDEADYSQFDYTDRVNDAQE